VPSNSVAGVGASRHRGGRTRRASVRVPTPGDHRAADSGRWAISRASRGRDGHRAARGPRPDRSRGHGAVGRGSFPVRVGGGRRGCAGVRPTTGW